MDETEDWTAVKVAKEQNIKMQKPHSAHDHSLKEAILQNMLNMDMCGA